VSKHKSLALLTLLLALSVIPVSTLAQETKKASEVTCSVGGTEEKIKHIAKKVVKNESDEEVQSCFNSLTLEEKTHVFEAMAMERGIPVDKLREEVEKDKAAKANIMRTMAGIPWRQLIELPWIFSYSSVGSNGWWENRYCDGNGTDPDVDYTFRFQFSNAVANPDALRSNRVPGMVNIEAMLSYYQLANAGIDGQGNTTSGTVYVCLGQNGVTTAGGPTAVGVGLRLSN
jgi:hypothetical protein